MSVTPLDFQEFVGTTADEQRWQICSAIIEGGGGGAGDSDVAVGPDGVTRVPLNVNNDGELKVNVEASINADLTLIENKLDTIIGIEIPQAADVAAIKTKLNNSIAVTGTFFQATQPVSGTVIANAGTNLNTSALALESGGNLATIATEAVAIDAKLPSLSSGRVPVVADPSSVVTLATYNNTGALALNTVLVPQTDISAFRTIFIGVTSFGVNGTIQPQFSVDGTNWTFLTSFFGTGFATNNTNGSITNNNSQLFNNPGYQFFRIIVSSAVSGGTNTFTVRGSQNVWQPASASNSVVSFSSGNVTPTPGPTAGSFASLHTLVAAATTNATNVKNSSSTIGTLILTNSSALWAYFKLVNKASAPTVGTDTAVLNIGVPPNTTLDCSTSFAGLRLTTGLSYYISAGTSLTDNTALPAAGTFLVNLSFI